MDIKLSASMMCANYSNLEREVRTLDEGGIDSFHLDIMDGQFVDNFGMGFQDMEFIRSATSKPLEAHLMINNPERYFDILLSHIQMDVVYIHPESTKVPEIVIEQIRSRGIVPGIAINPGTSIAQIEELLNIVDRVMVMCVVPGHAGRAFAPYVARKIDQLIELKPRYGYKIYWDGACTAEKIMEYAPKGVDGFILGTSVLFGHSQSYGEILANVRRRLNNTHNGAGH